MQQLYMPYFTFNELACKESNQVVLAPGFADRLFILREQYGFPMVLTSACRSFLYNIQIGGHPRSLHIYDKPFHPTAGTCAIDVHKDTQVKNDKLKDIAFALGWSIGESHTFLHLDRRSDYTNLPQAVFDYS